jgi:ferredoxin/flavodoxin---NADP+ reductase
LRAAPDHDRAALAFSEESATMSLLGSESRPLRVAIVGSGPAGFYAAEALQKSGKKVHLDIFDRLPTPYGLVRAGVAPDHQKLKSVIRIYEKIAEEPSFHFLGNVTVGQDVLVEELKRFYDAIILSSGAETDRRLGIPGEDLPGSHTATEFVGWYNGHPDYQDRVFDLSGEVAAVIGQGNVAMDVSRILAKTVRELEETDITQAALDVLARSRIREVHVIGRRGPVQAKFTPPEIKEFADLEECDPVADPAELELGPACRAELEDAKSGHARKNLAALQEFATRTVRGKRRTCVFRFYWSPIRLEGKDRITAMVLEKNKLTGEPFRQKAVGTGETITMPCDILFRSVGYKGVAIRGLPFDEREGVVPNQKGRITEGGTPLPGLYVSGWIKRGPSGVIGTNKPDSVETVESLLADLPALAPCPVPDSAGLISLLQSRGVRVVTFADWRRIDLAEIARGKERGKPREKYLRREDMLSVLG